MAEKAADVSKVVQDLYIWQLWTLAGKICPQSSPKAETEVSTRCNLNSVKNYR